MRSLDKMLFMVYTRKRNPERVKSPTGLVFVSEKRQEAHASIRAKQARKLREKMLDKPSEGA